MDDRIAKTELESTIEDFRRYTAGKKYKTIYADPPWQFQNRTGKVAPEHKRLTRYGTMRLEDIKHLPVADVADEKAINICGYPTLYCPRAWK